MGFLQIHSQSLFGVPQGSELGEKSQINISSNNISAFMTIGVSLNHLTSLGADLLGFSEIFGDFSAIF